MTITDFGVAIVNGDSHLSKWIIEHRRLDVDGSAHEIAKRFLAPGDVVIDGGACLGDHTIVYLNTVGPTGAVHAFEPNPVALECLTHNCPEALIYGVALGRGPSFGKISMEKKGDNIGAAVVLEDGDAAGAVPIRAIDSFFFQRVDLIKLDIEGMELDALHGAAETLLRCKPVVMAEINPPILRGRGIATEDVLGFMASMGYRWEFRDHHYGFNEEHTDVIFLPN